MSMAHLDSYICIYIVHVYSYYLQLSAKCYSIIMETARKSFGVNCSPLTVGHEFPDPYAEIKVTISPAFFRGSVPSLSWVFKIDSINIMISSSSNIGVDCFLLTCICIVALTILNRGTSVELLLAFMLHVYGCNSTLITLRTCLLV